MPEMNQAEQMIVRLALQDRLNHLKRIGIPDDHSMVKDTQTLLDRMRRTF